MKLIFILLIIVSCAQLYRKNTYFFKLDEKSSTVAITELDNSAPKKSIQTSQVNFEKEFYVLFSPPCGPSSDSGLERLLKDSKKYPSDILNARREELKFAFKKLERLNGLISDPEYQLNASLPELAENFNALDIRCFELKQKLSQHILKYIAFSQKRWTVQDDLPVGRFLETYFRNPAEFKADYFWEKDALKAFRLNVFHLLYALGDVPFYYKSLSEPAKLVSPDLLSIFIDKMDRLYEKEIRLPSKSEWDAMIELNPELCLDRYWVKEGVEYFITPKCQSQTWQAKPSWLSISDLRVILLEIEKI